jgi:hypothetical protein
LSSSARDKAGHDVEKWSQDKLLLDLGHAPHARDHRRTQHVLAREFRSIRK